MYTSPSALFWPISLIAAVLPSLDSAIAAPNRPSAPAGEPIVCVSLQTEPPSVNTSVVPA
jgi:hypothetical protein